MKKLLALLVIPLLLVSCEQDYNLGVHLETKDNTVHYMCRSIMVTKGGTLRIIAKGEKTEFISGNYVTFEGSKCPVCGWEAKQDEKYYSSN